MKKQSNVRYIFVTGGVSSSLGKGIACSSIASLLEEQGYQVWMLKIDPYINVDPGTMSPFQHGEVYVTADGAETDLDLGNYARFTKSPLGRKNSITTGQIYLSVIEKERKGHYLGHTVQVVPHIIDEIKERIRSIAPLDQEGFVIVEIGGTVGDIESLPFIEALRQQLSEQPQQTLCVHMTLIPQVGGELKTKPTQHSIRELRSLGITPHILLCRSSLPVSDESRHKIFVLTGIPQDHILEARDQSSIYAVPSHFHEQNIESLIFRHFRLQEAQITKNVWQEFMNNVDSAKKILTIALVGKYVKHNDAYKSVDEALFHSSIFYQHQLKIIKIDAELIENDDPQAWDDLKSSQGLIIPGGFGDRGIEGLIKTLQWARLHQKPSLAICLGMQLSIIEYARNVLHWKDANSTEFNPTSPYPVVQLLEKQLQKRYYGGSMRLGSQEVFLEKGTKIFEIYQSPSISERHRHRYEASENHLKDLRQAGLIFSAFSKDGLVEAVEWPNHPWGIAVQYHPEFQSSPFQPHPLFRSFIHACIHTPMLSP